MDIKKTQAYKYCEFAMQEDNKKVGKYVKKQCKEWLRIANGEDDEAYVDLKMFDMISSLLKLMVHPDIGATIYDGLEDYQAFFIYAILCTKANDDSRYYETGLLEIARKNFKTFTSAIIFIIEMLIEPKFSRFYSVAPDYKLSNELKVAIKKIIKSSPDLEKHFKIKRDMIECLLKDTEYTPLAYSNDKMDGKLAHCFLADECGAMDSYPIEAMRSSQITLKSKLGIIVSTQYPNFTNSMLAEIDYAKKVLDGFIKNKRYFSLLYEPDEELIKEWETNDLVIYQSNPVSIKNEIIFKAIVDKREMAKLYESKRENYLCKHNNIFYKGADIEGYVNSEQIENCETDAKFNWSGKDVYIGIDLAETWDNSSIAMLHYDSYSDTIYSKVWCFVQEDYIEEKSKKENVDYKEAIKKGEAIICGEYSLDYAQFEDFIINIPKDYGVNVIAIGYDIRNARGTAQRLERNNGFNTIEVNQNSNILHPIVKLLKERILNKQFQFEKNLLYKQNFLNCRCKEDTNLNKYIHKKVSVETAGKIDMVFATLDALYILNEYELLNNNNLNWAVQY